MKQITKNFRNFFSSFFATGNKEYKLAILNFDSPENRDTYMADVRNEEVEFQPENNRSAIASTAVTVELEYC